MHPTYGLAYDSSFLRSIPILHSSNSTQNVSNPLRLLTAEAFGDLHLQHTISHPPDNVLFPFLHGLEGDNHAQNAFFHSSAIGAPTKSYGSPTTVIANYAARVPKYRGLAWVICEEDLQADMHTGSNEAALCVLRRCLPHELGDTDTDDDEDTDEEDDCSSSSSFGEVESEDDIELDHPSVMVSNSEDAMDVVNPVSQVPEHIPIEKEEDGQRSNDEGKHMHPIQHRALSTTTIKTAGIAVLPALSHSLSIPISSASASIMSMCGTSDESTSASSASSSSSASYFDSASSPSMVTTADSVDCMMSPTDLPSSAKEDNEELPRQNSTYFSPCLLTSTFRPKELLKKVVEVGDNIQQNQNRGTPQNKHSHRPRPKHHNKDTTKHSVENDEWEFVPARVPDGISLRNFGIQVPIYATLCDIVVYSPKGPTKRAIALAERFRCAIEKKRKERIKTHLQARLAAWKGSKDAGSAQLPKPSSPTLSDDDDHSAVAKAIEAELEQEFLHYNVFVLSANEQKMRKDIPHLVMRVSITPEASASAGWEVGPGRLSIKAVDPKPVGDTMGMEINMDIDMDVDPASSVVINLDHDVPNTVDFAQREKDEMRHLTRASEIISCFPSGTMVDGNTHAQAHAHVEDHDLSGTTTGTHWDPMIGQVFLGNANDVPLVHEQPVPLMHPQHHQQAALGSRNVEEGFEGNEDEVLEDDPFHYRTTNDPSSAHGFDICIECHDLAPFPSASQLRAAEEHLGMLEKMWVDKCKSRLTKKHAGVADGQHEFVVPPRPPPNANAVIHLPFPSSPSNTQASVAAIMPIVKFLEKCIKPVEVPPAVCIETPSNPESTKQDSSPSTSPGRRWSSAGAQTSLFSGIAYAAYAVRTRSFTAPSSFCGTNPAADTRSRPLKILLYSSDGYTESSVPALCLLMAVRGLSLPEAYLELQTVKRRSFFVYQGDLGLLKRIEGRLREDRQREDMQQQARERGQRGAPDGMSNGGGSQGGWSWHVSDAAAAAAGYRYTTANAVTPTQHDNQHNHNHHNPGHHHHHHHTGRLAARSVSFAQSPLAQYSQNGTAELASIPITGSAMSASVTGDSSSPPQPLTLAKGRPRAKTSPWLPSLIGDHQSWFNDPRFDGSFPSRVLPFLYLGNLNHALNAYMLHALGITHVVSVGECALVPPHFNNLIGPAQGGGPGGPRINTQYIPGRGPGGQGSLWIEEREGRIKVLDIKGICDDGIDTLEPQLEPICDWIDKARQEGGKVLVHCRVGVSRSATVTIAYVMKHLGVSLVDAYLVVRSRRLSVLIQPNMRLLYNLCGWEIKLAKEGAEGDEQKVKSALARTLSWPYLAKEVHALNEKYLH